MKIRKIFLTIITVLVLALIFAISTFAVGFDLPDYKNNSAFSSYPSYVVCYGAEYNADNGQLSPINPEPLFYIITITDEGYDSHYDYVLFSNRFFNEYITEYVSFSDMLKLLPSSMLYYYGDYCSHDSPYSSCPTLTKEEFESSYNSQASEWFLQLSDKNQTIENLENSNKLLESNLEFTQNQVTTLSQSRGELLAVNASLEKQLQNKINLAYAQGLVDSGSTSDVVPVLIGIITLLEGVALVILIVSKIKNRKKGR